MKATQSQEEKELTLLKSLKNNLVARAKEKMEQKLIDGEQEKLKPVSDVVVAKVVVEVPHKNGREEVKSVVPSVDKEREQSKKVTKRRSSRSSSSSSSGSDGSSSSSEDEKVDDKERNKKREEEVVRKSKEDDDREIRNKSRSEVKVSEPRKREEEPAKATTTARDNVKSSKSSPKAENKTIAPAAIEKVAKIAVREEEQTKVISETKKTLPEAAAPAKKEIKRDSKVAKKTDKVAGSSRKSRSRSRSSHG